MKIRPSAYAIRKRNAHQGESGVALIIALLSLLIVSTLAAGLMSSTQSEIWTTSNYRSAAAARYAAEAGVQQATLFLSTWVPPTAKPLNNTTYFNLADLPVTYYSGVSGNPPCSSNPANCVVLTPGTAFSGITGTYAAIDSTTNTAFAALSSSTSPFPTVPGKPNFSVAAQLIGATPNSSGGYATTWKIISQGTVTGVRNTTVQVIATVESKIVPSTGSGTTSVPSYNFGAWANSTGCGAVNLSGGSNTESYDSSANSGNSAPPLSKARGDIATLGNVNLHNSMMVYGNIFAPHYNLGDPNAKDGATSTYYPYGVSGGPTWPYWNSNAATPEPCSATWPYAVTMDNSGGNGFGCNSSSCVDKASQLPAGYTTPYPSAAMPSTAPATNNTATCSYSTECAGNFGTGSLTLPPSNTSYGNVTFGSNDDYYLSAGNYYFDTFTMANSGKLHVTSSPVVIYILNGSNSTQPINFTGGSQTNQGGDPNNLTFVYNGAQTVHFGSISSNAVFATVYAPNAAVSFDGNGNIYGAVIANTVAITGGGHLNYDTHLATVAPHVQQTTTTTYIVSPFHIAEFSWSAF